MSDPFLIIEKDSETGIVTLTMDRPEERNALSYQNTFDEFVQACADINADNDVRCVILTGNGTAFCAGGNVKSMREKTGMFGGSAKNIRDGYANGIQKIPLSLYDLEVPTIAAVNGPAIGAGCDLACMCDIRIGSTNAKFGETFVKLGIIPGDGGAWLLPRVVGMSKAAELSFTGDVIGAEEALDIGMISQLTTEEELLPAARALATKIAANPPHALRLTKRLLREGQHTRLDTLLHMSAAYQALSHLSEDHTEALNAFFDKRPGNFQGR